MIEMLELRNFTAFDTLRIDFSPRINVVIGENATGKTHLLKSAYALCGYGHTLKGKPENGGSLFGTRLLRLFMPLNDSLGALHRRGSLGEARMEARFGSGRALSVAFDPDSRSPLVRSDYDTASEHSQPVFIPTKEILSFMKGFNSLYEKYELPFDQTYQDICLLLDLPEARPEALHDAARSTVSRIERLCGGRFLFHGGGKITFEADGAEFSANAIAEGFRKIGMLARLLETGAVQPGIGGPLFWDEPEANLNPNMMKLLVLILLELSRAGQQIVLATHDYVLLKWFDLLTDDARDSVRFHSLRRDPSTGVVSSESADAYGDIAPHAIGETFAALYDGEIDRSLGENRR